MRSGWARWLGGGVSGRAREGSFRLGSGRVGSRTIVRLSCRRTIRLRLGRGGIRFGSGRLGSELSSVVLLAARFDSGGLFDAGAIRAARSCFLDARPVYWPAAELPLDSPGRYKAHPFVWRVRPRGR